MGGLEFLITSFVICTTALTLALVTLAVRRDLLSGPRALASILVAMCATTAFWFATYWDDIWSAHEVNWSLSDWPQYALFAILLTAPIATIPLTLHWARHR